MVRSRIRYKNRGGIFTVNYFGEGTLQTTQTIITAMQKTNFLIRVEFPCCYNTPTPTRDLVPRSRTIRGEGRGKRSERRRSQHHQQGTRLHVERRISVEKFSAERR